MGKSKFRTTELSNPAFEMDGLRFITIKTPHLKGRGDICVFVPKGEDHQSLPVVTLLHGVYGSAWVWPFLGNAHGITQRLIDQKKIPPMVLVMPSDGLWGDGSGYMNHDGKNFEKWIAEDVPDAVFENIPEVSEESIHFIAGLSMGGFGALKIGAKYGEKYQAISAHSLITEVAQMTLFVEEPLDAYKQAERAREDVLTAIIENRENLPRLRFDCGLDDELLDYNRTLHQELKKNQVPHTYEEFVGSHKWEYWQEHLEDTLIFFKDVLKKSC
uniref:MS122, putative esterase n=1 Tax=Microscilla sp. PRE1 TaxID=155537 RepID=Q93PA9_9BACT|nr:alpha/beta hydrolase-fold protein [Microscilla sp. PRE1]AAK62844.1 MS122, putative esterase [Microscilla sp. PRE1]